MSSGLTSPQRAGGKNGPPLEPADHALGRSRGGFGTKLHVVVDAVGWIIAVAIGPGQEHETKKFEPLMQRLETGPLTGSIGRLSGDKGYSSQAIRDWLNERNIQDVIPRRGNEHQDELFDRDRYRQRNIVERTIGWLKEFRRIATRYEKLATHFLGMINLVTILQYIIY